MPFLDEDNYNPCTSDGDLFSFSQEQKKLMFQQSSIIGYVTNNNNKNNKSIAVKLSLTQRDTDQDVLLTLPSHARQKLLFPSCLVVITKAELPES